MENMGVDLSRGESQRVVISGADFDKSRMFSTCVILFKRQPRLHNEVASSGVNVLGEAGSLFLCTSALPAAIKLEKVR